LREGKLEKGITRDSHGRQLMEGKLEKGITENKGNFINFINEGCS